jgi:aminomethyltransferase
MHAVARIDATSRPFWGTLVRMVPMTQSSTPTQTPFYRFHLEHHAKMVPFAGWDMPLHYGSIIKEHLQVRRSAGVFDVSHMGRLRFSGRDATSFLERVCTRAIASMVTGQARYSIVCNEQGGCRDDVLVYRIDDTEYLVVCNAANRAKLVDHFRSVKGDSVFKMVDETEKTAMVALQGPRVMELLSQFSSTIGDLKRYHFTQRNLILAKIIISRTGYTGEDGVEVILPARVAAKAFSLMLKNVDLSADEAVMRPTGLGARDSLRLEAGMALYGHEIDESLDPISAGLSFAVKLDKQTPFIGQEALQRVAERPVRRLVGLQLQGKRVARQQATVLIEGANVGFVTSGCQSPTLQCSIAMAYMAAEHAEPGRQVQVDLGRTQAQAQVVPLPFYKR